MTNLADNLEERADYIEAQNLLLWNVDHNFFEKIQTKLVGPGAKLLVGPRGCGKTHQMRLAFLRCAKDKTEAAPVYVSFTRYYHLEPFLKRSAHATKLFHTWTLAKIIEGVVDAVNHLRLRDTPELPFDILELARFRERAEKGTAESCDPIVTGLTLPATVRVIESFITLAGRKRAVLLFDDAALTLTPEYLVEFFDIFRSLKTRQISPKASVYPGSTEYGPRFHVGQDAESIPAWLGVHERGYTKFLGQVLSTRFGNELKTISQPVTDLLMYASFGVPRAAIILVRQYLDNPTKPPQERFNAAIEMHAGYMETEYRSLGKKLPQYRTIVEAGWEFFRRSKDALAELNAPGSETRQITIGLTEEDDHKLRKLIRILLEVGLFYELSTVRHGADRRYERYVPHLLFLLKDRVFSSGRGFNPERTLAALMRPDEKHPLRRSFSSILGQDIIGSLKLDSPPCQKCGSVRISDEQRFCHNCGAELSNPSAFESCMELSIDELPIPAYQRKSLREEGVTKIGDFYTRADPGTRLRDAHKIGPVRSDQIYRAAKHVVEEFLER